MTCRSQPGLAAGVPVGAALREFCLEYAKALGLKEVCAVTKTTDFKPSGQGGYLAYVDSNFIDPVLAPASKAASTGQGGLGEEVGGAKHHDRGLNFHVSRGAVKVKTLAGWRPEDAPNEGHGILIRYDLDKVLDKAAMDKAAMDKPQGGQDRHGGAGSISPAEATPARVLSEVAAAVRELLVLQAGAASGLDLGHRS